MCLLLFCGSLFSSTESGNSSVLGVVKYFSVHFLHFMLNVPYQTSSVILFFFSFCFSGVGRTVWRVRARRPSFHTSWSERDSWRASIWNSTKSQARCCPSACGTAPLSLSSSHTRHLPFWNAPKIGQWKIVQTFELDGCGRISLIKTPQQKRIWHKLRRS